jgi:hypothetical protein
MKTSIQTIKATDVPSMISSIPNGAIFTATFIKKDGTIREMNCRKGVTKYLVPNARPKAPNPKNIITVFDMKNEAYRCINTNTLISLRAEKQVFEVK